MALTEDQQKKASVHWKRGVKIEGEGIKELAAQIKTLTDDDKATLDKWAAEELGF